MYFADIASSPYFYDWSWRTGWARSSIAGSENEGKMEIIRLYPGGNVTLRISSKVSDMSPLRFLQVFVLLVSSLAATSALAQTPNQRLVLKDGSYQVVTKYQKVGDRVRYFSAERGQWEEIPQNLVDWTATTQWAKDHAPGAHAPEAETTQAPVSPANPEAAEIDKEEQAERARTPEVMPGLRLPDEEGIWALDTFHDQPELVALTQNTGGVNHEVGHNILRATLNPLGGTQQRIQIPGADSKVKLHVNDPAFYVSLTATDEAPAEASAVTVETKGAGSVKNRNASSPASQYAIVRVHSNFKRDNRDVSGIKIGVAGKVSQTEDVVPTKAEVVFANHWLKLTPVEPLTIGEYALMELLNAGEVNLSVWDFRIDPQGPDNKNAIMPLHR
jgi:hypothetical protein